MLSETQVFNAIKERVEVNVAEIDKVIIICSDRIEGVQVAAIKKCMKCSQSTGDVDNFFNRVPHDLASDKISCAQSTWTTVQ